MKTLEKGQDKIKKIADELRHQTLEPAKKMAQEIIVEAEKAAEEIIQAAKNQANKLIASARQTIEQERKVFHASLAQACKQAVEMLKQQIETKLFNDELSIQLEKAAGNSDVIVQLVNAIVESIQKEGISSDISVIIPQKSDPKKIGAQIAKGVMDELKGGPIDLGSFSAGVQVRLNDRRMTLDITDKTLKEIISRFVPSSFHDIIFSK